MVRPCWVALGLGTWSRMLWFQGTNSLVGTVRVALGWSDAVIRCRGETRARRRGWDGFVGGLRCSLPLTALRSAVTSGDEIPHRAAPPRTHLQGRHKHQQSTAASPSRAGESSAIGCMCVALRPRMEQIGTGFRAFRQRSCATTSTHSLAVGAKPRLLSVLLAAGRWLAGWLSGSGLPEFPREAGVHGV
ncbi:hypothetical protein BO71DRAFT_149477 [Aspergillus ellipticus CBS 707.79]|uniref:Secreted protein n=1 Tax=Aspergillus ellipticus CBS 707.79 TaxID=1448320 RepID=A0A319DID5_9EURO|nr:hypothetical protein BO71DRAFT_149477 [Aspergillus ellipticus CBS 707.79]